MCLYCFGAQNRWSCVRNNNRNSWNFNNNGNFNNNNFNNGYRVSFVSELKAIRLVISSMVDFEKLYDSYLKARKNKRRSRDSVEFEFNYESNLINLQKEINDRTYTAKKGNYSFIVYSPKPREIFATKMNNRIVHHLLDTELRPLYEKELSINSFNNRVGKGTHAAIKTFREYIKEVSCNYTKDAYVYHLDIKGFFPNASVNVALKQQQQIIESYQGIYKEDLRFLMDKVLNADPARNCTRIIQESKWKVIPKEKSLFHKPVGTGAAIGFLCWQNAMGIYPNEITKYVESLGYHIVVFVDDIFVVDSDKSFLKVIPTIRKKLEELHITLNNKFYCQHYKKGILMLGYFLKGSKIFINRKTVSNSIKKCKNNLQSANSYSGLYANTNSIIDFNQFSSHVCSRFGFEICLRTDCFC